MVLDQEPIKRDAPPLQFNSKPTQQPPVAPQVTLKKSVKISDDGFMTSLKRQLSNKSLDIATIIETSLIGEDDKSRIRLSQLHRELAKPEYGIETGDIERLCQIANDKC